MDHGDDNYTINTGGSSISKVDVALMVFFWLISTWGYVAQYLISDEEDHISKDAKYWVGMTIPISTSLAALFKSIQVGMEVKEDRIIKKRTTIINQQIIGDPSGAASMSMSAIDEEEEEEESEEEMPKRKCKPFLRRTPSLAAMKYQPVVNSAPPVVYVTSVVDTNNLADAIVNRMIPQHDNAIVPHFDPPLQRSLSDDHITTSDDSKINDSDTS